MSQTPTAGLWSPQHRPLTVGLAITVTLVAFEALAVATVMPQVEDDLGGLALYGWVFSGFFLASLVGVVVAGDLADRRGPVLPYVAGLSAFSLGLLLGGAAQNMGVLVGARLLQGFGAGAIPAVAYAAIGRGIPASLHPKMFAVLSTAWVVPAVIGPASALAIEHVSSWRFVFWILLPVVLGAGALTVPALRSMEVSARPGAVARDDRRLGLVLVLTGGVGAVFVAGAGVPTPIAVLLVVAGVPAAGWSLLRLMPSGTFTLQPGAPAAVAVRLILSMAFFAADAYLPLTVVDGRGAAAWIAGLALTVTSVVWAVASWVQARLIDSWGPRRIDQVSFALLVASIGLMVAVAQGAPVGLVVLAGAVGGFAMGFGHTPLSVVVLAEAPEGKEGVASAGIQLSDALGIAVGTGVGGWLVAVADRSGDGVATGVTWVYLFALVVAVLGWLAAGRLPRSVPERPPPLTPLR